MSSDAELSSAQERMWFLHALDPGSPAYSIATAHGLDGDLDLPALRAATHAVAMRHDMLRSRFPVGPSGRPHRIVSRDAPAIVIVDCIPADDAGWPARVREAIASEAARPFDLQSGPLMRLTLLRGSPRQHVLIAVFHHIVADGWSLGVWHHELRRAYAAARRGEPLVSVAPAASMDGAIARERAYLASREGQQALETVAARLRDAPMLDLPMAQPRPSVARFAGARLESRLPADTVAALDRLARETRSSRFIVLASALAALLHRYSGQQTLLIGTPVANRADPSLADAIGLFVNTIVLRIDLDDACSMRDVVARVRGETLRGLDTQGVPFDRVVDRLLPQRALSHNPLFQVMCALQSASGAPLQLEGLTVTALPAGEDVSRLDLECTVFDRPDGLTVRLVYNTDLIEAGSAAQMLRHLLRVVTIGVTQPDLRIAEMPLATAEEAAETIARERGAVLEAPPRCLHALFEEQAARTPDAIAVQDATMTLTFAQVDAWADALARQLRDRGVGPDRCVGVCVERTIALPAAILGVLKSGAAVLPLSADDSSERHAFILADAAATLVVASAALAAGFDSRVVLTMESIAYDERGVDGGRDRSGDRHDDRDDERDDERNAALDRERGREHRGVLGDDGCGERRGLRLERLSAVDPSALAYVIYTSGTAGRPKGVQVEHRQIVNTLRACQQLFAFGPGDCGLVLAADTFDVFYYELFAPLLGGGRARIVSRRDLLDPVRIVPMLAEATCFQAVPGVMEHLLHALAAQGVSDCPRVRLAMTGGDVVPPALLDRAQAVFPHAIVSVTYGPTETAVFCTCFIAPRGVRTIGHPIGRPMPGTVVRVGDARGRPLPAHVNGEIWIGGAGVARGYANSPAETAARFVTIDGERFYRSGDRGRAAADGSIEFLGRADRQIKIRGFRIEPAEIETVLAQAPHVAQSAVRVLGESSADKRLAGYIVLEDDALRREAEAFESRRIAHWRHLFDGVYGGRVRHVHEDDDFTGWISSITGAPFPFADLDAWVASAVTRITRGVDPNRLRRRALRVLEIGCGSGLILLRIAPLCERYVATDFSARALADLRQIVQRRGLTQVELHQREAGDLAEVGDGFDLVILNSVAQYLPNAACLRRLLADAVSRTRPDGMLFLGDLRSLALLEMFHAIVESARGGADDAAALPRARWRAEEEEELVLHPAFFRDLAARVPGIGAIACEPRDGGFDAELSLFRYDVTLYRPLSRRGGDASGPRACASEWHDWRQEGWTVERLQRVLHGEQPSALALRGVAHAAAEPYLAVHRAMAAAAGEAGPPAAAAAAATAAAMGAGAIAPDVLRGLAESAGYAVRFSALRGCADAAFDVYLERGDSAAWPAWPDADAPLPAALATNPAERAAMHTLATGAHRFLASRVAAYMVPASLTVMRTFPRTANGKLDVDRLPVVPAGGSGDGRPPETRAEREIAAVWDEVLGQRVRGADEDFFAAGGTSLLAVQVSSLLRARGLPVTPQQIFEQKTIAAIAAAAAAAIAAASHVAGASGIEAEAEGEAEAEAGHRPPRVHVVPVVTLTSPTANTAATNDAAANAANTTNAADAAAAATAATPHDAWNETACVLLTGATGMLGMHLLDELLARTRTHIVCLVRASDDRAARARLWDQYRWYFPGAALAVHTEPAAHVAPAVPSTSASPQASASASSPSSSPTSSPAAALASPARPASPAPPVSVVAPAALDGRVEIVAGDLTQPRLGLAADRWTDLARRCDAILHAAADVRHVGRRERLRDVNYGGVGELLSLARAGGMRFHHMSTVGVRGHARASAAADDLIVTEDLLIEEEAPENVYVETKAAAERLVLEFLRAGGRASIIRIGTIAPHGATGRFQRNIDDHFFSRYVRALMDLGIACDEPRRGFRLIPADAVAQAVRVLTGAADRERPIAHLQTPHELTQAALIQILNGLGYRIARLDRRAYDAAIAAHGRDAARAADLARLLPLVDTGGRAARPLAMTRTEAILRARGFTYPAVGEAYIARFVRFGVELGYFAQPAGLSRGA